MSDQSYDVIVVDRALDTEDEMIDWFRSGGNPVVGAAIAEILIELMPDLKYRAITYDGWQWCRGKMCG